MAGDGQIEVFTGSEVRQAISRRISIDRYQGLAKDSCRIPDKLECGTEPWVPQNGARDRTRTCTPYGTRPSNVCVYQFHHPSISNEEGGLDAITRSL